MRWLAALAKAMRLAISFAALVVALALPAQATVVAFSLSDVAFGGGAIATGTFTFDTTALNILSTTISVTGAAHTEENGAYSVSGFCSGTNCFGTGVISKALIST